MANFGCLSGVAVLMGVEGNWEKLLPCGVELLLNEEGKDLADRGVLGADAAELEAGGLALSPRISSRITLRQLISFVSSRQRKI